MVSNQQFDKLVDLCQELSGMVDKLAWKVSDLEEIARHQESKIDDLNIEVDRLIAITDHL